MVKSNFSFQKEYRQIYLYIVIIIIIFNATLIPNSWEKGNQELLDEKCNSLRISYLIIFKKNNVEIQLEIQDTKRFPYFFLSKNGLN